MGDIADWINEGLGDADSGFYSTKGKKRTGTYKTCKYCGEKFLHWADHETGWRLAHANGDLHDCPEYQQ